MVATEWQVQKSGPGGSLDEKGLRTYTVPLDVFTDSQGDGPQVVMDYLIDEGFALGAPYAIGNDDDSGAHLTGISAPSKKGTSGKVWTVTLTYKYPEGNPGETHDGGTSPDPEDWLWKHEMQGIPWQEPCWRAWNHTPFPHPDYSATAGSSAKYTRDAQTLGPIVNSAGVVLDPTLMRDSFDGAWRVTCFSRVFDWRLRALQGRLNEDPLDFHPFLEKFYGFARFPLLPYELKCAVVAAGFRTTTINKIRVGYWEWVFEWRWRYGGWLDSVLDRGITARAAGGDADGTGDQMGTLEDAVAPAMPVLDGKERRVPELVLFDGGGWPMTAGADEESTGFFFDWRKDALADFKFNRNWGASKHGLPFAFFQ